MKAWTATVARIARTFSHMYPTEGGKVVHQATPLVGMTVRISEQPGHTGRIIVIPMTPDEAEEHAQQLITAAKEARNA